MTAVANNGRYDQPVKPAKGSYTESTMTEQDVPF